MRILIAEDDRRMADLLCQALTEDGHALVTASGGLEAVSVASAASFDLILLDVMLPGITGLEVARRLRGQRNQTPILMLTARDADRDVVAGLDHGADDYLTKPFSLEVLLARVRAVGRRGPIAQPVVYRIGDLTLNQATREVERAGRGISLTRTEYSILETLVRASGRVVSRDGLIETVWGAGSDVESNTLDAFMRLLRAKIELGGEPKLLRTVRGIGYCLREQK